MSKTNILVADIESTGFSFRGVDRVISYGGTWVKNGKPYTDKDVYLEFNPVTARSSAAAEAVHGLTHKYLKKKKPFEDNCKKIIKQLKKADVFVGHNASFDVSFLKKELALIGEESIMDDLEVVDTAQMARKRLKTRKFNLDFCCEMLGVENNRTIHNALEDAQITARLFIVLSNIIENDFDVPEYKGDQELTDAGHVTLPTKEERKKLAKLIGA